jgi:hypothetical protein
MGLLGVGDRRRAGNSPRAYDVAIPLCFLEIET